MAYALGLVRRGYRVEFLGPPGQRTAGLEQAGVPVLNLGFEEESWLTYLRENSPDIIHQHVPGYPLNNPIYRVWPKLGDRKPKLIETNVFGRLEDPAGDRIIAFRMFISQASATQAFRRAGRPLEPRALERQTVLYYPVEPGRVLPAEERSHFRRELGIGEDEIMAVRIGQPASTKWELWECEAFARAKRRTQRLRLLIMEPPEWIQGRIQSGSYPPGILVQRATSDFDWLGGLYGASDLMIHASSWGESFGYTIAEGLAAGLPLIVRTTPWGDNAQVELVVNGQSGFVCSSVGEMSRRLAELAINPQERRRMGREARARICRLADPERELDVLEGVIGHVLFGTESPALEQRRQSLLEFADSFRQREWALSEPWESHPWDHAAGRIYATYRQSRTRGRLALQQLGIKKGG